MMDHRVYYVGIRWNHRLPRVDAVERLFDPLGDWIRFNESTWFLSTSQPQSKLGSALKGVLGADQTLLVIALDPKERFGWAPQWVWDWIDGQRDANPRTVAEIVGEGPPVGAIGDRTSSGGRNIR
jgi:hypothetical protein